MNEDFISFEAACLLKEKRFKWFVNHYYNKYENFNNTYETWENYNDLAGELMISAPTLYVAQKWLRETENVHIDVYRNASGWLYNLTKADNGTLIFSGKYKGYNDGGAFNMYTEALDAGIIEALKII